MIYNFSYRDHALIKVINETVGKPFGFMDRLRLKGIGSSRFVLQSASEDIERHLPSDQSLSNVSVELRPKGIIVHFKKFTEHYTWVIPYYRLTLYYSNSFSIHSEGQFMKIASTSLKKHHQKFLRKLMDIKGAYAAQFSSL